MALPTVIEWTGDAASGHLRLLDQTQLPGRTVHLDCRDVQSVWDAIKRLSVRGAPAIGIAAAYGCVIGAQRGAFDEAARHLATSRPTAVNLFWAIERMKRVAERSPEALLAEARRIHEEDAAMCRAMGEHAAALFEQVGRARRGEAAGVGVLTHCNAGALATGGIGTATAGMYVAHERGMPLRVFADETRPLLQGARLTAFELGMAGIDVTLICDSMAAQVMRDGCIDLVIVGADRIAANGDTANKVGTYGVAVLAQHHGVPFYVAAPSSTFDLSLPDGSHIPIEQRDASEILPAPLDGVRTHNPAFDVTPHELIAGIVTERGVIAPVRADTIARTLA
jgi:methylthioribose-1-phosphate isomerase